MRNRPWDIRSGTGAEQSVRVHVGLVSNVGPQQYVHCRVGRGVVTVCSSKIGPNWVGFLDQ